MLETRSIPRISTLLDSQDEDPSRQLHREAIHNTLSNMLNPGFFEGFDGHDNQREEVRKRLHEKLPYITTSPILTAPFNLSFYLLNKDRPNSFKFFFEMISNWLVPGKRLNIKMLHAADFSFPDLGDEEYTLCEIKLKIESDEELAMIKNHLLTIEAEICLGVDSAYYASRILEVKGLSADEKIAAIQEKIAALVCRFPQFFKIDVFTEMQHFLVISSDEFKNRRCYRHLTRLISTHYLFRTFLQDSIKRTPQKRHVCLKLYQTKLISKKTSKNVLGIIIGINFLRDKEIIEERHLLKAIQTSISNVQAIPGSFIANRRGTEPLCTLYIEIEKTSAVRFTNEEVVTLRKKLPTALKDRIEYLMHPVFMPSNEEEIFRHIVNLSKQIKYLRDIPQVVISFDKQTYANLYFTVILVRVLKGNSRSVQVMFKEADSSLGYIHDRCHSVGFLRKKYAREATVFKVKLPKDQFLRSDHSIDLFKARQTIVSELGRIMGEVRDFNGGMISKQNELLIAVHSLLADNGSYPAFLLDNFFYSLSPGIMRNMLEPQAFKTLFFMLIDALEHGLGKEEPYYLKVHSEPKSVFAMIMTHRGKIQEKMNEALLQLSPSPTEVAMAFVYVYDTPCLGIIYNNDDVTKRLEFCQLLELTCKS